jgi:hypothetical protein
MRKTFTSFFLLIVFSFIACWPALLNGQPFFFTDTYGYLHNGHVALTKAKDLLQTAQPGEISQPSATWSHPVIQGHAADAGRSAYYGVFLDGIYRIGGFGFVPIAQALIQLSEIGLLLTYCGAFRPVVFGAVVIVISALTPFAFFNTFLMPDVFAGSVILAVAALVVFGPTMPAVHFIFWFCVLTAGLLFHASHIAIAGILLFIVGALMLTRRIAASWRGIGAVGLAMALAAAGNIVPDRAAAKLSGERPIRQPLFMARLIADGPGYRYLAKSCPESGFAVCAYLDRLKGIDFDTFLYTEIPGVGVVALLSVAQRRALSDEQFRFASAVARFDPPGFVFTTSRNALQQLLTFGVDEFNYGSNYLVDVRERYPEPDRSVLLASAAARGAVPTTLIHVLTWVAVLASLAILGRFFLDDRKSKDVDRVRLTVMIVLAGIITNAIVCGVLSGPFSRFEARVIWLIPFLAILTLARREVVFPLKSGRTTTSGLMRECSSSP